MQKQTVTSAELGRLNRLTPRKGQPVLTWQMSVKTSGNVYYGKISDLNTVKVYYGNVLPTLSQPGICRHFKWQNPPTTEEKKMVGSIWAKQMLPDILKKMGLPINTRGKPFELTYFNDH